MKILAKGFVFRLAFMVLSFCVNLLIAKLAGASLFGSISLMIVNAAVIQIITGLGTDAAIVWHGASGGEAYRQKAFTFTLATAGIQIIVFLLASFLFLKIDGRCILSHDPRPEIFYAELLYFSGLVFLEKFISLFYSQQKAALCNALLAAVTCIFVIVLIAGDRLPGINISGNLLWFFCLISPIQAALLAGLYFTRFSSSLTRVSGAEVRSFINFSLIVFFTNLLQFLAYRADYWFVNYFHDIDTVGIYAQANRFSQLLWIIPNILASLVMPLMATSGETFDLKKFSILVRLILIVNIGILILLMPLSFFIYRFFLPQEYYPGLQALLLMVPGYIIFTAALLMAAFFSSRRMLWINFRGSLICFTIIITTDFILIPAYGINGAAISNTIAYTVATLYFICMFNKRTGIRFSEIFNFRRNDFKSLLKASENL